MKEKLDSLNEENFIGKKHILTDMKLNKRLLFLSYIFIFFLIIFCVYIYNEYKNLVYELNITKNNLNTQTKDINKLNLSINNLSKEINKKPKETNELIINNKEEKIDDNLDIISNEIICEYEIKDNNKEFKLFDYNKYNLNELEQNFILFLNDKKISFNNKYKVKERGAYSLIIKIKKPLTNIANLFSGCLNLVKIEITNFISNKVTDMSEMFYNCNNLKEIIGLNNLITNNVIYMDKMFSRLDNLAYIDVSNFNTRKVESINNMFSYNINLVEIKGLNNLLTDNVIDMSDLFRKNEKLTKLDLSNFNTARVIHMNGIFEDCINLKEIKGINYFITDNVLDMNSMFKNCKNLNSLNISNFKTNKVIDMSFMFFGCENLHEIVGINNMKTNNVLYMNSMFCKSINLKFLDLSNFETFNVTDMRYMFKECVNLKEIKGLNNFKTDNVLKMSYMFSECHSLRELDLSNFKTYNVKEKRSMFYHFINLKVLNLKNFELSTNDYSEIFTGIKRDECLLIAKDENIKKIYYENSNI